MWILKHGSLTVLAPIADHKITHLAALLPWNWRSATPVDRAA
jgi:hypothetical protein